METRGNKRQAWPATICSLAFSILVVLAMAAGPLHGAVGDIGDQKVIQVPLDGWSPGEKLDIHNLAGRMVLAGGGAPSLEVTFHAEASGGLSVDEILDLMDVRAEKAAGGFKVTTVLPLDRFSSYAYPQSAAEGGAGSGGIVEIIGSWFGGFSSSSGTYDGKRVKVTTTGGSGTLAVWADYRLVVPAGSQVSMNNFAGVLNIHEASGEFRLDTGSGDVKAAAVKGALEVDTGSGDVSVSDFSGSTLAMDTGSGDILVVGTTAEKLVADTGSGDVSLKRFSGGHCGVDTGSGDVLVDLGNLENCSKILVDTGSGDVVVAIPPDAPFSVRADTGSGDVMGDPDGARRVMDDDELVGFDRGHGGTSILVDTGSGDVLIRNR